MKGKISRIKPVFFSLTVLLLLNLFSFTGLAASAENVGTAYDINLSLVYGLVAAISFSLLLVYRFGVRRREMWLTLLFSAVFVVNAGYFLLSVSRSLDFALWANRVSYLGSAFLPLCMFMSIAGVCRIKPGKIFVTAAVIVACLMFLLAASGGWLSVYYKQVSLVIENGTARLEKVYGELHVLYLVYLVVYFSLMVGIIGYAIIRKRLGSYKYAAMLALVVLLNLLIWFLEQIIDTDFEFLSVSYIVSELLLMFIYGMLNDHNELHRNLEKVTAETQKKKDTPNEKKTYTAEEVKGFISALALTEALTSREEEVLILTLSGEKRKAVADALGVSENTVKTHLSHIFAKLGVSSKKELTEKIFSEKE